MKIKPIVWKKSKDGDYYAGYVGKIWVAEISCEDSRLDEEDPVVWDASILSVNTGEQEYIAGPKKGSFESVTKAMKAVKKEYQKEIKEMLSLLKGLVE